MQMELFFDNVSRVKHLILILYYKSIQISRGLKTLSCIYSVFCELMYLVGN